MDNLPNVEIYTDENNKQYILNTILEEQKYQKRSNSVESCVKNLPFVKDIYDVLLKKNYTIEKYNDYNCTQRMRGNKTDDLLIPKMNVCWRLPVKDSKEMKEMKEDK